MLALFLLNRLRPNANLQQCGTDQAALHAKP